MNTIICYTTNADGTMTTDTFNLENVNHLKEYLFKIHELANGLQRGQKVTFYRA